MGAASRVNGYTEDPGEEIFALPRSSPPWSLQQQRQVKKTQKRTRQKIETDHLTSSGRVVGSQKKATGKGRSKVLVSVRR